MYIQDDVCYAGNAEMGVKILSAEAQANKKLLITFSTGEKRIFDPQNFYAIFEKTACILTVGMV